MTERIDQLLVKAGAYFGGEGVVYDRFDPKKFAELIVAECALTAGLMEHEGRKGIGAQILDNFGVEE
jgi:hypothetical protein